MPHLTEKSLVYAPPFHAFSEGEMNFFLDEEAPHWIATDSRGAEILDWLNGRTTFGALVARYALEKGVDAGKAWLHVHDFLQAGDPIERFLAKTGRRDRGWDGRKAQRSAVCGFALFMLIVDS